MWYIKVFSGPGKVARTIRLVGKRDVTRKSISVEAVLMNRFRGSIAFTVQQTGIFNKSKVFNNTLFQISI